MKVHFCKNFVQAFARGAGAALGAYVAKKWLELAKNEQKKNEVKQKVETIKKTLLNEEEES